MSEGTYPYGFGGAFAALGRGEAPRLFGVDGLLQRILLAKKTGRVRYINQKKTGLHSAAQMVIQWY